MQVKSGGFAWITLFLTLFISSSNVNSESLQLTFSTNELTVPAIYNGGNPDITWSATGTNCDFSLSQRESWMMIEGLEGSSCDGRVFFTKGGVADGTYQGEVQVCVNTSDCVSKVFTVIVGSPVVVDDPPVVVVDPPIVDDPPIVVVEPPVVDDPPIVVVDPPVVDDPPVVVVEPSMIRGITISPKPLTRDNSFQDTRSTRSSTNQNLLCEGGGIADCQTQTAGYERGVVYPVLVFIDEIEKQLERGQEIKLTYQIRNSSGYSEEKPILPYYTYENNKPSSDISIIRYGNEYNSRNYELYFSTSIPVGKVRIKALITHDGTPTNCYIYLDNGGIEAREPCVFFSKDIGVIFNAFESAGILDDLDEVRHSTNPLSTAQLNRYVVYDREKIFSEYESGEWNLSPHDDMVFNNVSGCERL